MSKSKIQLRLSAILVAASGISYPYDVSLAWFGLAIACWSLAVSFYYLIEAGQK